MATVTSLSTQITNRDASPRVLNSSTISKGAVQCAAATIEIAATDNIGSTYTMMSIPSNARVMQVLLSCDDSGSVGTADIGLYQTTANGGAVVDANHFATAQAFTTALKNSDVTFAGGAYGVEDLEKPVWEAAGLSADSRVDYDVTLTLVEAAESAATVSLQVVYVI